MSLLEDALKSATEKITKKPEEKPSYDPLQVAAQDYEKADTPAKKLAAIRAYMKLAQD